MKKVKIIILLLLVILGANVIESFAGEPTKYIVLDTYWYKHSKEAWKPIRTVQYEITIDIDNSFITFNGKQYTMFNILRLNTTLKYGVVIETYVIEDYEDFLGTVTVTKNPGRISVVVEVPETKLRYDVIEG